MTVRSTMHLNGGNCFIKSHLKEKTFKKLASVQNVDYSEGKKKDPRASFIILWYIALHVGYIP